MERPDVKVTVSKTRGANRTQQNHIKDLGAQGYTPEEISDFVRADLDCVTKFMKANGHIKDVEPPKPEPEPEPEPEPKPTVKKSSKKKAIKKD